MACVSVFERSNASGKHRQGSSLRDSLANRVPSGSNLPTFGPGSSPAINTPSKSLHIDLSLEEDYALPLQEAFLGCTPTCGQGDPSC